MILTFLVFRFDQVRKSIKVQGNLCKNSPNRFSLNHDALTSNKKAINDFCKKSNSMGSFHEKIQEPSIKLFSWEKTGDTVKMNFGL